MIDLWPLGERAWLAKFPTEAQAHAWAEAARSALHPQHGSTEVVLAYRSVAVFADQPACDLAALEQILHALEPQPRDRQPGPLVEIPVLYDGADLDEVAGRLGLSVPDVIDRHIAKVYIVYALGFLPGFPYCGYLPEALSGLPRRAQPRAMVPAGSVAIAGRQTGVYPRESPGGWHLLGRTPLRIVDLEQAVFPLRPGDRVRFRAIDSQRFADLDAQPLLVPGRGPDRAAPARSPTHRPARTESEPRP